MKRTILATILLTAVLSAVEIVPVLGGNYHIWTRPLDCELSERTDDGIGWHVGGLLDYRIIPGLSVESGILYRHSMHPSRSDGLDSFWYRDWKFNSIEVPLLVKNELNCKGPLKPTLGGGILLYHVFTGSWRPTIPEFPEYMPVSNGMLGTSIGLVVKGEFPIKVFPYFHLKPAVTLQVNAKPDYTAVFIPDCFCFSIDESTGIDALISVSFGLAFKL